MAQASPPLDLASADPQSFIFPTRGLVKVQVRFYSDAAGTVPIAPNAGSRDVTVTMNSAVAGPNGYRDYTLESAINNGTVLAMAGGTWYEFNLSDGAAQINVSAALDVNPGPANSYRILVDVERGV